MHTAATINGQVEDLNDSSAPLPVRLKRLEQLLLDPDSECYLEGLLDVVAGLVEDTACLAQTKSNRLLNTIHEKFKIPSEYITKSRVRFSDFDKVKHLGKGAFGEVQLVRHATTREVFALKILSKAKVLEQPGSAHFWEERDIMARAKSNWIVKLVYAMQDLDNLYMVMEFMPGGTLFSWINECEADVPEDEAIFYVAETILGLEALHKLGYIHRDVKPNNILLDHRGHVKLADFGTAIQVDPKTGRAKTSDAVGTPDYLSPEVLLCQGNNNAHIGFEVDWWAVGCMLYEMLYQDPPFFSPSLAQTYNMIMNHKQHLQFPPTPQVRPDTVALIRGFLSDYGVRLGAGDIEDIKTHPCFNRRTWDWATIQHNTPPFVPQLSSDTDTTRFELSADDSGEDGSSSTGKKEASSSRRKEMEAEAMKRLQNMHKTSKPFTGEHLSFAGFTFIHPQFSLFRGSSSLTSSASAALSGGSGVAVATPTPVPGATVGMRSVGDSGINTMDSIASIASTSAEDEMRNQIRRLEVEKQRLLEEINELDNQLDEANDEQEALAKERKILAANKAKLEDENAQLRQDLFSSREGEKQLRQRHDETQEKLDTALQDLRKLDTEKTSLESKLASLQSQLTESQHLVEQHYSAVEQAQLRQRELTLVNDSLQHQLNEQRTRCTDIQKHLSDKECELRALQTNYERVKQEVVDKRDKEQLDKRLQMEHTQREILAEEKLQLEKRCRNLELDLARSEQTVQELRQQEDRLKSELEKMKSDAQQMLRAHQLTLEKLRTERETLQDNLDSETHFKELYKSQMEEAEERCNEHEQYIAQLRQGKERCDVEIAALTTQLQASNSQIIAYQEQMANEADKLRRREKQLTEQAKKDAKTMEESIFELSLANKTHLKTIGDVKKELSDQLERNEKLTKEVTLLKDMNRQSVNKLMDLVSGKTPVVPEKGGSGGGVVSSLGFAIGRSSISNDKKLRSLQIEVRDLKARLEQSEKKHIEAMEDMRERLHQMQVERDEARNEVDNLRAAAAASSLAAVQDHVDTVGSSGPLITKQQQQQARAGASAAQQALNMTMVGDMTSFMVDEDEVENYEGVLEIMTNATNVDDRGMGGVGASGKITRKEKNKNRRKLMFDERYARILAADNMLAFYENSSALKPLLTIRFDQVMVVRRATEADAHSSRKEDIPRLFHLIVDLDAGGSNSGSGTMLLNDSHVINDTTSTLGYSSANSLSGSQHSIDMLPLNAPLVTGGSVTAGASFLTPNSLMHNTKRATLHSKTATAGGETPHHHNPPVRRSSLVAPPSTPNHILPNVDYNFKNHKFQTMFFRVKTNCHVCQQPLNSIMNPPPSLQCLDCHLKICPTHVTVDPHNNTPSGTRAAAVPQCGKSVCSFLLRAPSERTCERWLKVLKQWVGRVASAGGSVTSGYGSASASGLSASSSNLLNSSTTTSSMSSGPSVLPRGTPSMSSQRLSVVAINKSRTHATAANTPWQNNPVNLEDTLREEDATMTPPLTARGSGSSTSSTSLVSASSTSSKSLFNSQAASRPSLAATSSTSLSKSSLPGVGGGGVTLTNVANSPSRVAAARPPPPAASSK